MADLLLSFDGSFKEYDCRVINGELAMGSDLESAVIISLFTWARAKPEEVPEGAPRYGWFGDKIDGDNADSMGSKLYLLKREKITEDTISQAKEYIQAALAWLIDDGIASEVNVDLERNKNDRNRVDGIIVIRRGDVSNTMRFDDLWSAL